MEHNLIKIIMVDQQTLFRVGVSHMLKNYPMISMIADATTGKELFSVVKEGQVDIAIISTNIEDMSVASLIKRLKRDTRDLKVLVLSDDLNFIVAKQYLLAGADGFLLKSADEADFVEALQRLNQSKTVMPEALAQSFAAHKLGNAEASPFDNLSEREMDILLLMVRGKTPKEMSQILHLSPKTISTYKGRIFEKLNVVSMMDVFWLAMEFGLIRAETSVVE